jgi:hypothetical protein
MAKPGRRRCSRCLKKRRETASALRRVSAEYRTVCKLRSKKSKDKIRRTLIDLLGGECVCCGETVFEFLTFDHKHNDGAAHRRELGINKGSNVMYRLMLKDPKVLARFQLLCWNCNCSKGAHGACPHAKENGARTSR